MAATETEHDNATEPFTLTPEQEFQFLFNLRRLLTGAAADLDKFIEARMNQES